MGIQFVYASISMGAKEDLEKSIDVLMDNASINQFVFYDETMENIIDIEPEIARIYFFVDLFEYLFTAPLGSDCLK